MPYLGMKQTMDTMTANEDSSAQAAESIVRLVLAAPADDMQDRLTGQLHEYNAPENPAIYFMVFEGLYAADQKLAAIQVWRQFINLLSHAAEAINADHRRYGATVQALGRFIEVFDKNLQEFTAFHVFSETVQAALNHFDAVTMNAPPLAIVPDGHLTQRPAIAPDSLALGDQCIVDGDDTMAAAFFRRAGEEEDKPEGWLRLLQLMAEADLGGEDGKVETAADVCAKAVSAGYWYARPYYMMRALMETEADSKDTRDILFAQATAYVQDFCLYILPSQKGFSKYTTPALFQPAAGIFNHAKGDEVIRRIKAVTEGNAIKASLGAFANLGSFMLQQEWLSAKKDMPELPSALTAFLQALTEENRLIAESLLEPLAEDVPFAREQRQFSDTALRINEDVGFQIEQFLQLLSESN